MSENTANLVIKRYQKITETLVDLFKILNADMNAHSPLRIKYGEDCFHDLKDMTDAFIVYCKNKPVGCAILKHECKEVGIITNIYVAPDFRRHGVCYKLFEAVEKRAKECGYLLLIGDTWNELIPMQKAYLKGGFTEYTVAAADKNEEKYYAAGHNYWKLLV